MTDALSQPAVVRTQAKIRTAGRAIAVQLLYAYEQNKYVDDGQLLTDDVPSDDGVDPLALAYAKELFTCFVANRIPVDAAIDKRLENWTIHRLAVADRSVLRLGAVEILYRTDTPPKVAINEAIELAKLGKGSLCSSITTANDEIAKEYVLGTASHHGRILIFNKN